MKQGPELVLLMDGSVNDRIFHIYFSVLGSLQYHLLPHGYSAWLPYLHRMLPLYQPYAWHVSDTRIMSGYGSALFELGFLGLLIPASITAALYRGFRKHGRLYLALIVFVNAIMWTSIPLSFPLVSFLIGYVAYATRFETVDQVRTAESDLA
jgi:hypothetical protein